MSSQATPSAAQHPASPHPKVAASSMWHLWLVLSMLGGGLLAYPYPRKLLPTPVRERYVEPDLVHTYHQNKALLKSYRVAEGQLRGAETVLAGPSGTLLACLLNGSIAEISEDGQRVEEYAYVGGRPLSAAFNAEGDLYVADANSALLLVRKDTKEIQVAASRVWVGNSWSVIAYPNDVVVSRQGTVYFTDSSKIRPTKDVSTFKAAYWTYASGTHTGRLLSHDPSTRATSVLLDGLYYANGVALSEHEDFALVAETFGFCIHRVWLGGSRKGEVERFACDLPGFPDGVSWSPATQSFWVAIHAMPSWLGKVGYGLPWLRFVMLKFVLPVVKAYGLVLEYNADGELIGSLHDPGGEKVAVVTAVTEHKGRLYLGSLGSPFLTVYDLAERVDKGGRWQGGGKQAQEGAESLEKVREEL